MGWPTILVAEEARRIAYVLLDSSTAMRVNQICSICAFQYTSHMFSLLASTKMNSQFLIDSLLANPTYGNERVVCPFFSPRKMRMN